MSECMDEENKSSCKAFLHAIRYVIYKNNYCYQMKP